MWKKIQIQKKNEFFFTLYLSIYVNYKYNTITLIELVNNEEKLKLE